MKKQLVSSQNSLSDVIKWLKDGFIICLYSSNGQTNIGRYFYSKETLDELNDVGLIYINVSCDSFLLCDDEWTWYIKDAGFVEYKSLNILPTNADYIYNFSLN